MLFPVFWLGHIYIIISLMKHTMSQRKLLISRTIRNIIILLRQVRWQANLKFYDDILCGFYSTKLTDWDKALNDVLDANGNQLFMVVKEVDNLFNGETDDYRKDTSECGESFDEICLSNNATSEGILSSNLIPIIRMSEIYYIAAEACFDKDPSEAIDYLMQVKKGRNLRNVDLSGITLKSDFMDRLISDARREFLGEGQIFFMFKRLNQSVPTVNNWKPEYFILMCRIVRTFNC